MTRQKGANQARREPLALMDMANCDVAEFWSVGGKFVLRAVRHDRRVTSTDPLNCSGSHDLAAVMNNRDGGCQRNLLLSGFRIDRLAFLHYVTAVSNILPAQLGWLRNLELIIGAVGSTHRSTIRSRRLLKKGLAG